MMPSLWPGLFLLPATISALTFDCEHIQADGQRFDLSELKGPKSVHLLTSSPPSISNTTFTLDICVPLKKDGNSPSIEQCSSGTRICAVERDYQGDNSIVKKVVNIAGDYSLSGHGGSLDPKTTRLNNSESHGDSAQEGLRVVLNGGVYKNDGRPEKQRAIIEFLCDKDLTGNEGFSTESQVVDAKIFGAMSVKDKREGEGEGEGDGGDDNTEPELPDLDEGKSLQFLSYETERDLRVLRLSWKTKYACESVPEDKPAESKKGGWGFFTWFLIVAFLLVATYIIFGSWLNYNRYGARGWDLIPHGDAIRDLPHIIKDGIANISDRFRGSGGSRGGYSAV